MSGEPAPQAGAASSFVAIDLEFTSRDQRLPLQLGLVEVDRGTVSARHTSWFRVVGHPWPWVTGVHCAGEGKRGQPLTKELYERAPLLVDAWPSVAALIAERPVFAHGAGLDIARLRAGFDAHGLPWPFLISIAETCPAGAGSA